MPAITYILNQPMGIRKAKGTDGCSGPMALVMAPTRELAVQIQVSVPQTNTLPSRGLPIHRRVVELD